jgi:hypothetical protein
VKKQLADEQFEREEWEPNSGVPRNKKTASGTHTSSTSIVKGHIQAQNGKRPDFRIAVLPLRSANGALFHQGDGFRDSPINEK